MFFATVPIDDVLLNTGVGHCPPSVLRAVPPRFHVVPPRSPIEVTVWTLRADVERAGST